MNAVRENKDTKYCEKYMGAMFSATRPEPTAFSLLGRLTTLCRTSGLAPSRGMPARRLRRRRDLSAEYPRPVRGAAATRHQNIRDPSPRRHRDPATTPRGRADVTRTVWAEGIASSMRMMSDVIWPPGSDKNCTCGRDSQQQRQSSMIFAALDCRRRLLQERRARINTHVSMPLGRRTRG